jgi:hypothetical protein
MSLQLIRRSILIALVACPLASAQVADYLGPGVVSTGAGKIGQRAGQDVDFQLFGGVQEFRDSGLVPLKTDSDGKLVDPGPLYGTQVDLGGYGTHAWRRVKLGLDYSGNYRRYADAPGYDGTNQRLQLGVTYQKSRRIVIDSQLSAATVKQGGQLAGAGFAIADGVLSSTSLLFDNRYTQVQGGMDVSYLASSRTVYTMGGTAYTIHRGSSQLAGVNGYVLRGSIKHRISRVTTLLVSYEHTHYDYPRAFGEADIEQFSGGVTRRFGRAWDVTLSGGVYQIQTQGVESVSVDPAIAALLGTSLTSRTFYKDSWLPTIVGSLSRAFRRASLSVNYSRGANPGNGVYLASQKESYGGVFSYSGIRKWSFSIGADKSRLSSVAQQLVAFNTYSGYSAINRKLGLGLQLGAQYTIRNQKLVGDVFNRTGSTVSINLTYSPGDIPVSLH